MITIHLLPALYGDTFLLDITDASTKENTNILIDCGFNFTEGLLPLLQQYNDQGKIIDRFIITHYDSDHISGATKFIELNGCAEKPGIIPVSQVWMNGYRHLQFDKPVRIVADAGTIALLHEFMRVHDPDRAATGVEIGARQAILQGKTLLQYGYNWNTDFDDKAVCVDLQPTIPIGENVTIHLLGPTQQQLTELEGAFEKELRKMNIPLTDDQLVDDAFELFVQELEKTIETTGLISGGEMPPVTIDSINWLTKKAAYVADIAPGNGSSIAFILEADGKKILLLGDAPAEPIIEQLRFRFPGQTTLYFDAVKVAHHGSLGNNPKALYDLIDSPLFIFSTNGEHPSHAHPDLATIAFIIDRPVPVAFAERKLVFNYPPNHLDGLQNKDLMSHFHYSVEIINILILS